MLFLPPAPTLAVDGLAIARYTGVKWVAPVASRDPAGFWPLGIGRVGTAAVTRRLRSETVPEGIFLTPSSNQGVMYSGIARVATKVRPLSPKGEAYRSVVRRVLKANGVSAPVRITQAVRVDLDRDGTDEVILAASSRGNLAATGLGGEHLRPSDYSLVLVRSVGSERTLWFRKGKDAGYDVDLAAIADLNADGLTEIVLRWTAWEAGGAELWSYRKSAVRKLAARSAGV